MQAIALYAVGFSDYWWTSYYGVGMGRRWRGQFLVVLESVAHAVLHSVHHDIG
jgi:hypothetical protein